MFTQVHIGVETRGMRGRKMGPDTHVHSPFFQVCEIIESPLFLKLNPMTKHTDVSSDPVPTLSCLLLCPCFYCMTSLLNLLFAVYHL